MSVKAVCRNLAPVTGRNWKLFFFPLCLSTMNSPRVWIAMRSRKDDGWPELVFVKPVTLALQLPAHTDSIKSHLATVFALCRWSIQQKVQINGKIDFVSIKQGGELTRPFFRLIYAFLYIVRAIRDLFSNFDPRGLRFQSKGSGIRSRDPAVRQAAWQAGGIRHAMESMT